MEGLSEAEERCQLSDIAEKWAHTENEATQDKVLQSMADYTKLYLSRLKNRGIESSSREHCDGNSTSKTSIPHRLNPSIQFKKGGSYETEQAGRVESIMQIGNDPVRLEELIRVFDQDVVRSGK